MAKATSRKVAATPAGGKRRSRSRPRRIVGCGPRGCGGPGQGEVIELLINRHLAGYVVQIRGERVVPGDGKDRLESEGQVNRAGSTAA